MSEKRKPRRVWSVVAVVLGLAVFGFGYWMAFLSVYLKLGPSDYLGRVALQADLLKVLYLLLGGFSLYAVGAYLFGGWKKQPVVVAPLVPANVVVVKVRCLTCRQLNDEEAKYCNQCGHVV